MTATDVMAGLADIMEQTVGGPPMFTNQPISPEKLDVIRDRFMMLLEKEIRTNGTEKR